MNIQERLAYCAGVIDGEGSINISHTPPNSYELSLTVRMQSKVVINNLGGLLTGSVSLAKDNKTWKFNASSDKASKSLERVLPYLSNKKRQAELAIKFNNLPKLQGKREYPESLLLEKEDCYKKMKEFHQPNSELASDYPNKSNILHAYCAGIIDGEGWVGIGKSGKSYSAMLSVEMTDLAPINIFANTFNSIVKIESRRTKRGKIVYRCRLQRQKAREASKDMLPYLKEKYQQAELIIRYVNMVSLWGNRLEMDKESLTPERILDKLSSMRDTVKILNQHAGAETKPKQPEMVSDSPVCNEL
jgi:hypothetical protein